jgi:hypothetical protein
VLYEDIRDEIHEMKDRSHRRTDNLQEFNEEQSKRTQNEQEL